MTASIYIYRRHCVEQGVWGCIVESSKKAFSRHRRSVAAHYSNRHRGPCCGHSITEDCFTEPGGGGEFIKRNDNMWKGRATECQDCQEGKASS